MKFDYALYTLNERKGVDLILCECGWQRCLPNHSFGPLVRSTYMLHYLVDGEGTYVFNNKKFEIKKGDLFLITPSTTHYYYANSENPYEYYWAGFIGAECSRILEMIGISKENPVISIPDPEEIGLLYLDIIDCIKNGSGPNNLEALGCLYRLLGRLAKTNPNNYSTKEPSTRYVSEAMQYIHENFMNPITVVDIARHISLHRSYLTTLFKQHLQMSVLEYLITYRISMACKLMRSTNMTIQEIGLAVGFPDHMNFSTRFKKYKGMSPSEYRKVNYDRDINPLDD